MAQAQACPLGPAVKETPTTTATAPAAPHAPASPRVTENYGDTLSRRARITYILVLGALVGLGPFTIDLYLPAFPVIGAELATSDAMIQLTLTATTVGFGLGQLLVGPLSDKVGRRVPLLVATGVHVLASFLVAAAPTIEWVMAGRILQGIGAAGGGVVAMAMVRDLFGGQRLVRMLANLALVTSLAPVLAPVIGSQLLQVMDWRGIFYVLAAYGVIVTVTAAFLIIETLPAERRARMKHSSVASRYRALLTDRVFVGVAIVGGMNFAALFAYLSASSFLLQDQFSMSAQQYGLVFGINSIGVATMVQLSSRLMRRIAPAWVLATALFVASSSAIVMMAGALLGWGLAGLLIPLFTFTAASGMAFPAVQVTALINHGSEAGTAASLLGAMNFGLAGIISPVVGMLGISIVSMAGVMIAVHVVAAASLWLVVRPWTVARIPD